LKAERNFN